MDKLAPGLDTSRDRVVFKMVFACVTLQVKTAPRNLLALDRRRWLWMLNFPSGPLCGSLVLYSSSSPVSSRNQVILMDSGLKPNTRHTSSPEPWSKVTEGLLWVTEAEENSQKKNLMNLCLGKVTEQEKSKNFCT